MTPHQPGEIPINPRRMERVRVRVERRANADASDDDGEGLGDGEGVHLARKVGVRLSGIENSNSHGARPVHLIITMMKWFRTSRLSMENSLSGGR